MKIKCLCFICIVCCMACQGSQENACSLQGFVDALKKEHLAVPYKQEGMEIASVPELLQICNNDTVLLYALNSSCSLCIAQLYNFCLLKNERCCTTPLIVIVDERQKNKVEYYAHLFEAEMKEHIYIIENKEYKFLNMNIENNDLNGLFFGLCKERIFEVYLFINPDN